MFVFAGLLVISIGLSVWFVSKMPREHSFESESGNILSAFTLNAEKWLYATSDGMLVKMSDDRAEHTYNVTKLAQKACGMDGGTLRKFYKAQNSDKLWFFFSYLDEGKNSASYLFQAQEQGDALTITGYTSFEGNLDNLYLQEQNGFLYVVTTGKQVAELFKIDVSRVEAGVTERTYLYDCARDGQKIKLTAIRMPDGINCFETDGEYLYILYNAGMIRVATDFSDVRYESSSSSYKIDSLDASKYISFGLAGISSSGGAFVKANDSFYVTARDTQLYKFSVADISDLKIGDSLKCETVSGITLNPIPQKDAAIFYDDKTGVGYVLHDSSSQVTKIDFKTETVDFSFKLEFNIEKMIQGATEDDVFYLYKNVHKTNEAEKAILSHVNAGARKYETFFTVGFYGAMTLVLINAVTFVVLTVIVCRKKEEKAKKILKQMRKQWKIYAMLLPSLILLIMFCYYEAIASILLSFFDYSVKNPTLIWNHFANYKEVFLSSNSLESFRNLVIFLVFDLLTAIVPPLIFAFFLTVMKSERLSNGVRTLLFIAHVVPAIAGLLIWKTGIYGGNGALNFIIKLFGGEPIAFLGQSAYAKWAILMIGFPFVGAYLIFYGGMMNIEKSYYEAAELEGIGIWRRFISIDIPLIVPQLKYVFITSFIASLQNFQRTYMITGGNFGTKTPIHLMYQNMVNGEYGRASAFATVIFILLFGATYLNLRKQRQELED